jgi:hypothetical protein
MLPRRRPDAVHRVYAEDEAGEEVEGPGAEGEPLEPTSAWDEPVEPPFAGLATGLGRRNRVAAMALLGAVVGVLVVLLAHGMHGPAVGGGAARIPEVGPVVSVPAPLARHRPALVARRRVVVEVRRARVMPEAPRMQSARAGAPAAMRAVVATAAGDVASVTAAQQSAGSEFGFER